MLISSFGEGCKGGAGKMSIEESDSVERKFLQANRSLRSGFVAFASLTSIFNSRHTTRQQLKMFLPTHLYIFTVGRLNDHFPRLTGNTESLPLFLSLSALAYGLDLVQWSQVNAASERNYVATIHSGNRVYVWGRLPSEYYRHSSYPDTSVIPPNRIQ